MRSVRASSRRRRRQSVAAVGRAAAPGGEQLLQGDWRPGSQKEGAAKEGYRAGGGAPLRVEGPPPRVHKADDAEALGGGRLLPLPLAPVLVVVVVAVAVVVACRRVIREKGAGAFRQAASGPARRWATGHCRSVRLRCAGQPAAPLPPPAPPPLPACGRSRAGAGPQPGAGPRDPPSCLQAAQSSCGWPSASWLCL